MKFLREHSKLRPRPAAVFLSGKRFTLVMVCFLSCLIFQVSAGANLEELDVGVKAPDFSLEDFNGQSSSLADLRGEKLTMVIFWATWSRNSGKALAKAQKLYTDYKEKGLTVIAVNADRQQLTADNITAVSSMVQKLGLEYPVLLDKGLSVFYDYGVIALPSIVIMDSDRTIRYILSGYPIVGSKEMIDFIVAKIEGRAPTEIVQRKGYQPGKETLRFYNMGKNALKSNDAATAEKWFKKAAEADPKFVQPHISLGRFYAEQNQVSKAQEQFDLALQKEPENVVALCELGMTLVKEDKFEEGKALMQKAITAEDYYPPCFFWQSSYVDYIPGKEGKMEYIGEIKIKHAGLETDKLCFACHDPFVSDYANQLIMEPADLCLSCHDRQYTRDGKVVVSDMKAILTQNKVYHFPIEQKDCSGCHNPHGSNNFRMLLQSFPEFFYAPYQASNYKLCFMCHQNTFAEEKFTTTLTRFRNGNQNLHFIHVNKSIKGRTCRTCHGVHATNNPNHLKDAVPFGGWQLPINFEKTETGGKCWPGCHHQSVYDRDKPVKSL
jgi:predicted CXXCH cytochrome family protein